MTIQPTGDDAIWAKYIAIDHPMLLTTFTNGACFTYRWENKNKQIKMCRTSCKVDER